MKFHSKQILLHSNNVERVENVLCAEPGFSLVEAVTSLIILALISSSVLVVVNRCIASATDSSLRMQAFEVARENMEALMSKDSVEETVEYGSSDKYPAVTWQTTVEAFYEPITKRVWVRGICSAEYDDTSGQTQSVELKHWLTDVTKQQMIEFLRRQREEDALLAEHIIETVEEAAEYAGVDVQTFEQWMDNGLLTAEDGSFIKDNIDIFKQSDGNPSPEAKDQQVESVEDITEQAGKEPAEAEPGDQESPTEQELLDEIDPVTGLTYGELEKMDFWEVWQLLLKKRGRDL